MPQGHLGVQWAPVEAMDHPTQLDLLGGLPIDFYTIEMHLEDLEDLESGPPDEFGGRMLMAKKLQHGHKK